MKSRFFKIPHYPAPYGFFSDFQLFLISFSSLGLLCIPYFFLALLSAKQMKPSQIFAIVYLTAVIFFLFLYTGPIVLKYFKNKRKLLNLKSQNLTREYWEYPWEKERVPGKKHSPISIIIFNFLVFIPLMVFAATFIISKVYSNVDLSSKVSAIALASTFLLLFFWIVFCNIKSFLRHLYFGLVYLKLPSFPLKFEKKYKLILNLSRGSLSPEGQASLKIAVVSFGYRGAKNLKYVTNFSKAISFTKVGPKSYQIEIQAFRRNSLDDASFMSTNIESGRFYELELSNGNFKEIFWLPIY